ncbi:MAG: GNAT family N-acetyltransferase [Bacteroidales bacterium]|nr:GNAT family N-acetyltransferase [Bacteroidales bacterium]
MNVEKRFLSLRALEFQDIDLIFEWENDQELWIISNTLTPFSRYHLEQYILNSSNDIYTDRQLRLMVSLNGEGLEKKTIGCIDLFDFEPHHRRAGVGIMIGKEYRNRGFAFQSLELLIDYAFNTLSLHQLYCNVSENNEASMALFKKAGFEIIGIKRDWVLYHGKYQNEVMLQKINN